MPKCQGTVASTGAPCTRNVAEGKLYCCKAHEPKTSDNASPSQVQSDVMTMSRSASEEEVVVQPTVKARARPSRTAAPVSSPTHSISNTNITNESDGSQLIEALGMLGQQVDNLNARVDILSKTSKTRKAKNPRKMTPAGAKQSARWAFYREHKDTEHVVQTVRAGLVNGKMLVTKKKVVDGNEVMAEIIPWGLKKLYTDVMFDRLTPEQQQTYIDAAFERNSV